MRDYAILTSDLLLDEGFLTGAGPSLSSGAEQFQAVPGAERPGGFCRPADGRDNPPDRGCRGFRSQAVVDCRDIVGTNCYCSDEALSELRRRLSEVPLDTIHWIDTGDYHYLTALFLERIGEPFELVLFDNHPDDQAPAFGDSGLLSCGGWVAWARERIPEFRQRTGGAVSPPVRTVAARDHVNGRGPSASLGGMSPKGRSSAGGDPGAPKLPECSDSDLPVYLSIDLDVLSREEFVTDWDQGEMRFSELLAAVRELAATRRILGIDVCGGLTRAKGAADSDLEKNLRLRTELRSFLTSLL